MAANFASRGELWSCRFVFSHWREITVGLTSKLSRTKRAIIMNSTNKSEQPQMQMAEEPVFGTVIKLWPYIWPHDRPGLKRLVFIAVLLLVAA